MFRVFNQLDDRSKLNTFQQLDVRTLTTSTMRKLTSSPYAAVRERGVAAGGVCRGVLCDGMASKHCHRS